MDKKICEARLSNSSIIQLPAIEAYEALKRILKNACSISGLCFPKDLEIAESLKKSLLTFFLEFGYKVLNEEEFNLAFLLNTVPDRKDNDGNAIPTVENFGEFISVLYCSRVLSNYMILRLQLDRKLQNIIDGYS